MEDDKRLEEAIPLVLVFLIAAALFSFESHNIWYFIFVAVGSGILIGIKWATTQRSEF